MQKDIHFDGIAHKFQQNIYGTLKGKLRHAILTQLILDHLTGKGTLQVLDLGGGTGVMSAECLQLGHWVDLVDASQEVLNIAQQTLSQEARLGLFCSTIDTFKPQKQYDLVMCHAVLEWLHDPYSAIAQFKRFLKPHGVLSLSVFNKDAARFGNMSYGNFDYVEAGMKVKKQVRLNPLNPVCPKTLIKHLGEQGFRIDRKSGIRCFSDYVKRTIAEEEFDQLLRLEMQYYNTEPYLWLGKYFHVFASLQ